MDRIGRRAKNDMPKIPESLKQHDSASLLGRIRHNLYEEISGRPNWMPEANVIRHYLLREYRLRPQIGMLFTHLLGINSAESIEYVELKDPPDVNELLARLEQFRLKAFFFLEIKNCPDSLPSVLGACVYCERLAVGGLVYVVTLVNEKSFPAGGFVRLEIRASKEHPNPMFSLLTESGYKRYDLKNYRRASSVVLALRILNAIGESSKEAPIIRHRDVTINPALVPPDDPVLVKLIQQAHLGALGCSEATVSLEIVQPHDIDFCLRYPMEEVKWSVERISEGIETPLLVYWKEDAFIMSDDYSYYLAYRALGYNEVPIVAIGGVPENVLAIRRSGGAELIPPPLFRYRKDYRSLPTEIENWMLDGRLKHQEMSGAVLDLYMLFIQLALLLEQPTTKERHLHEFLKNHPTTIDPYGFGIMSEVCLGKDYRIDLVIQYELDERRLLLIELEKASLPVFTKSGRLRSHVTHAIQQVEDWLQWWHEHPSEIPEPLDRSIPPDGLVVIGRNINLDEKSRRRLVHLNHNRRVKLITYDDLLDRIEALIKRLEVGETELLNRPETVEQR